MSLGQRGFDRLGQFLPLRGRWLQYFLIAALCGLWGACLFRAFRFWLEARQVFAESQALNDWADVTLALRMGSSYAVNLLIGLTVVSLGFRRRSGALIALTAINLWTAVWLTQRSPEEPTVLFPSFSPLLAFGCNLIIAALAIRTLRRSRSAPGEPSR